MKRSLLLVAVFPLCIGLSAQSPAAPKPGAIALDTEVATVELSKRQPISLMSLKSDIGRMESALGKKMSADERKQYLDLMINDILFLQYCDQIKLSVSDAEVANVVQSMKTQLAQAAQANPKGADKASLGDWAGGAMSDASFYSYLSAQGVKQSDLTTYVRKRLLLQKYIEANKDKVSSVSQPSYDEISTYYEKNKAQLVRPDTVVLGILFFDTRGKSEAEKAAIKDKAQSIARQVKGAPAKFDEYVIRSKDSGQNFVGQSSYPFSKTEEYKQLFGDAFYDAAFSLKKDQVSDLVSGPSGFHILRAEQVLPQQQLALNDQITVGQQGTVADLIRANLYQAAVNQGMQDMLNNLVKGLRGKAKISVKPELLNW